jgi:hypothetical protein
VSSPDVLTADAMEPSVETIFILGLRNALTPEGFQLLIEIVLLLLNVRVLNPELFLKMKKI